MIEPQPLLRCRKTPEAGWLLLSVPLPLQAFSLCQQRSARSCADGVMRHCADTVPMALRMVMGKEFPQGPFKLGVLQPVINAGAIIYMVVSVVRALPSTFRPACSPRAPHRFLAV